ncbi:family 16 glycoside hydrolase [Paractinoplanes lichenicola]|uniref:Cellulose-binding protein n=1 Tax=Paractinoplanes lichenicola TaxID=2802976 RepID=A0ABS1VWY2_9ACTN|nr:family 16 glycoside hydrolase [Actinoplanes lichenicola]MBL7258843.1 cellulose-binding protein [Actinoplanes lichenicola]
MSPSPRTRRGLLAAGLAGLVTAGLVVSVTTAEAATVFSSNFESGASGWSKSGGSWSLVSDGSQAYAQTDTGSERARQFAGDTSWTNYSVQARVKATAFGSTAGVVALTARAAGATKMYRLSLTGANRVQLEAMNGSAINVLGSLSQSISTSTWYTLRLNVSGSTISGTVNGTSVGSATDTSIAAGRIGLLTESAAGRFDDVVVDDAGGTTPTTPPATTPPATTPPATTPPATTPPATTPPPTSGALYVAPNGSASADGSLANPTTLASAITRVAAGGTIYLRGGTYSFAQTVTIAAGNNGTSSARKRLTAYAGEVPVLNFAAQSEDPANRGLAVNGNYWHLYGIVVERAGDNGIFVGGSNNIFERTVTRFNRDSGLQISRIASDTPQSNWPANNLVLSAESHDNADSDGEDADGFAAKLTVGSGNTFRYAVSHNNIDDGWDLYTKTDTGPIGPVTIEDSLAYNNGTLSNGGQAGNGDRNGYKLGGEDIGVNHTIRRNIAYKNGKHGFTYNRNLGTMSVSNNVSIDNTERNFSFDGGSSVFRSNTSCRFASGSNDKIVGNSDSSNQFWSGTNGSRCSTMSGALAWSFASNGSLVVTLGGRVVTP